MRAFNEDDSADEMAEMLTGGVHKYVLGHAAARPPPDDKKNRFLS